MISFIRKRFTYANVAMTLALVFAMTGGAYAAKHYLITSTKQISPKVLKALAGKPGPVGPQGATGPQGPQGPAGANGKDGLPGAEGKEGPQGKEGKQGPQGVQGKEGSPWTAGGTLPSGQTETGTWTLANGNSLVSASFNIPLSAAPEAMVFVGNPVFNAAFQPATSQQRVFPEGAVQPEVCEGNAAKPTAPKGVLCVYIDKMEEGAFIYNEPKIDKLYSSGGTWFVGAGEGRAVGTWAVTAK